MILSFRFFLVFISIFPCLNKIHVGIKDHWQATIITHWGPGEIDGLLVFPGKACKATDLPSDYWLTHGRPDGWVKVKAL